MNTLKFGNGEWYGKKDTILAYNDLNSNFKPLPFSFDRASSATRVNKEGLIETVGSGEPRIDYKDDAKGALLLEPQRTNYVLYSETEGIIRGSNGWSGDSDSTITQNYGTTPFTGSELKSTRIQFTSSSKEFRNNTSSVTIIPTASIWIKGLVGKTIKFGSNSNEGTFTLNGEWQKLVQTGSSLSTNRLTINTYSSTTARDIEIFAPQLEQGSYATSYIPTSGQENGVTRVADVCTNSGNDQVINSTEGVLYFESTYTDGSDYNSISISNTSGTEKCRIWYDNTNLVFATHVGGVNQTFIGYPISKGITYKIGIRYKLNDFALFVDGVKATNIIASLGGVSPANSYNHLSFTSGNIYNNFYGNCKDLRVYNTALTDAELQALTSN